ncbi:MAG: hypothetical protein IJQ81_02710, partial [Oscillibacter sp.]|nr:hypothetical protein [Oscillibacter sp.]
GEGDRGRGSDELPEPPREMLSMYPQILTARPADAAKPIRRKPTPRKPYRYAGTFRTRRKRPGRRPRKRRRITRPGHAPRSHAETLPAPEGHSEASPAPQARNAGPGTRRRLSGKAMRRCFYCLLCGCWLSWPFC